MPQQRLNFQFAGLYDDPSPYSGAPPGAMREAKNVVIRREGYVEPRPGFDRFSSATAPANVVRAIVPYKGDAILFEYNGSAFSSQLLSTYGAIASMPAQDAALWRPHTVEGRGSLYLASTTGLKKKTAADTTAWAAAGIETAAFYTELDTSGTGYVVSEDSVVAYRAAYVREDANGYIRRSAPSARSLTENVTDAVTRNVTLRFVLPADAATGDVIEVYRSELFEPSTEVPDDELYLATRYTVTAADVTAGTVTVTDSTPADDLGAALYTNSSQQGILQQNEPPPACTDLASFAGHTFFADTVSRYVVAVELARAHYRPMLFVPADTLVDVEVPAAIGATVTSGSATITSLDSSTGLAVGMKVADTTNRNTRLTTAGTYFPANTSILSITGAGPYTVTVDKNALASSAAAPLYFGDTVTVNSVVFAAGGATSIAERVFKVSDSVGDRRRSQLTADALSYVVSGYFRSIGTAVRLIASTAGDSRDATLIFSEIGVGGSTFTVSTTKPTAFWPALTGTKTSSRDDKGNRLMWSKNLEPEAVPITNYTEVGLETKRILRIVPTRDALFIFKEDGTWRLTGSGGDWRIDPFDPALVCVAPDSLAVLDGTIFGLFQAGVCAISDGGVKRLSAPSIDTTLRPYQFEYAVDGTAASTWGLSNESNNEYLIGFDDPANTGRSDYVYALNSKTGTFTRWDIVTTHGARNPADGKILLATPTPQVLKERKVRASSVDCADASFAVTISNVTGTTITISGGSGWTPAVGDAVVQGGTTRTVISFASATVFTVDATGLTAAAATAYVAFECVIEALADDAGNPGIAKLFRDATWLFDDLRDVVRLTPTFTSDVSSTLAGSEISLTRASAPITTPLRLYAPREHGRAVVLYPKLTIKQATARWRLAGMSLIYEPVSERVRRSANA